MEQKLALVTGGTKGIGRAICVRLAKDGMNVVFSYNSGEDLRDEVVKACEEFGVKALGVKCNVSEYEQCQELVQKALDFSDGKIDVLVNNAGITKDNLIMKMTEQDFDDVIDVNLKGTFYMMKYVSKLMLKQRSGHIINISSVVGVNGNAGQVNYSASKAGVIGMTKSLAKELAGRKITVNAVAPGMIETNMTAALNDKAREAILGMIPMKCMGNPEQVAAVVSFLASEDSSYVTGQVICVDGGMAI